MSGSTLKQQTKTLFDNYNNINMQTVADLIDYWFDGTIPATGGTITGDLRIEGKLGIGGIPAFDFDMTKSVTTGLKQVTANLMNTSPAGGSILQLQNEDDTRYSSIFQTNSASNYGDVYANNSSFIDAEADVLGIGNVKSTGSMLFYVGGFSTANEFLNVSPAGNMSVTGSTSLHGVTATAFIDIVGGIAGAAPFRLRSGVAPTAPNDGDIWFDGTNIKMRIGGVTKTFTLV